MITRTIPRVAVGRPDGLFGIVCNVHSRVLAAPAAQVRALLDGLGRPGDRFLATGGPPSARETVRATDGLERVEGVGRSLVAETVERGKQPQPLQHVVMPVGRIVQHRP